MLIEWLFISQHLAVHQIVHLCNLCRIAVRYTTVTSTTAYAKKSDLRNEFNRQESPCAHNSRFQQHDLTKRVLWWFKYTEKSCKALRVQFNNTFRALLQIPRFFAVQRIQGFPYIQLGWRLSKCLNNWNTVDTPIQLTYKFKLLKNRRQKILLFEWSISHDA